MSRARANYRAASVGPEAMHKAAGGSLPDDEEARQIDALDELWARMTPDERDAEMADEDAEPELEDDAADKDDDDAEDDDGVDERDFS